MAVDFFWSGPHRKKLMKNVKERKSDKKVRNGRPGTSRRVLFAATDQR